MNRTYTIIASIALVLTGCGNKPPQPEQVSARGKELMGPHLLRQIGTNLTESASFHGGYFLFAASGSVTTDYKVTFAWLGNDGVYRFTTLPIYKVRVQINDGVGTPYVQFRWSNYGSDHDGDILYVLIETNSKDWPTDIHLPDVGK